MLIGAHQVKYLREFYLDTLILVLLGSLGDLRDQFSAFFLQVYNAGRS